MSKKPMLEIGAKVRGHFVLERYKGDENGNPIGECLERLEFDNHITDTGMAQIYNAPADGFGVNYLFGGCAVGTGNTAPADTDTQLAAFLSTQYNGQYNNSSTYIPGPPAYWKWLGTYQFATGTAEGNIAEIGIYPFGRDQTQLFSRALVLDGSGNPTTITVLSDEVLNVTYEFRTYIDTSDVVGTFVSDGVTYDTVLRVSDIDTPPIMGRSIGNNGGMRINAYDGNLGTTTTAPSGNTALFPGGSFSNFQLVGGQASADYTTTLGVNSGNWTNGVRAMTFWSNYHKFQMSFNDPNTGKGIPKVSGEQMTVGVRFKWSRYAP